MATIADECKKELGQTVFSIFYDVDPSDVRKQSGVYEDAFVSHRERFKQDLGKVDRWKRAMTDLASSAGWDVRDKAEYSAISEIIQKVIEKLDHKFSGCAEDLVGIQPRVKELEELLKFNAKDDDFRVLGIWGMGGIGKTTLANVLYDKISYMFEARCFIEDVSKNCRDGGAIAVQRQILRQTLGEQNLDNYGPSEISGIIRNRLSPKEVLIVLDNVDEIDQLENLAISLQLLGKGSRMIITTRNERILTVYKKVDKIYEVSLLNSDDARELFGKKAFKNGRPSCSTCKELTPSILEYAQGLPLAIRVLGSLLYERDASLWRDVLERLRKYPERKIMAVLQISFDDLQHDQKEIFLHIACFFNGTREEYVRRILKNCGFSTDIGIRELGEKSLITIKHQDIYMHEMLQELGKKIVREESPEEPKLWSRLWLYKDFHHVLMSEMEENKVKAIVIDHKEDVSEYRQLRIEGLSKMKKLNMLILYHKNFSGSLDFLSADLRYLLWHAYPFSSLPLFEGDSYLVELNLPYSSMERLWEGPKEFRYLERVDVSNSKSLRETPNFERCPGLKRLDFSGCTNLKQVHASIGTLKQLAYLNLQGCSSLVSLDLGIECKLGSLTVLDLSSCKKLESTPDLTGLSNLEYLDLEQCTNLSTIHESFWTLAKLKFSSWRGCVNLVDMPTGADFMTSVQSVQTFRGCLELKTVNWDLAGPKSLIFLDLGFCNLREVPDAIGRLGRLERLNLEGNKIHGLPDDLETLTGLAYLNLSHCYKLESLPRLPCLSSASAGRYFKMVSQSRNQRSGLYMLNCINLKYHARLFGVALCWLSGLVKQPCNFRCGFDIVIPFDGSVIPKGCFNHQFKGGSVIRIMSSDVADTWIGFSFFVLFEVSNSSAVPGSSSLLPYPLYLSFESEHTEECFEFPLSLDMDKVVVGPTSKYCWIIYISREHCHFVKTGAHITFKARSGLKMEKWGLSMLSSDSFLDIWLSDYNLHLRVDEDLPKTSSSTGPKILLPYNWLVTEQEENENMEAKAKENSLSNMGL